MLLWSTAPLKNQVVIAGAFSSFSQRFRHPFTAFVVAEMMILPLLLVG
jgi:hypothetical protein